MQSSRTMSISLRLRFQLTRSGTRRPPVPCWHCYLGTISQSRYHVSSLPESWVEACGLAGFLIRSPAPALTLKSMPLRVFRRGSTAQGDEDKHGVCFDDSGVEVLVVFAGNFTGGECIIRLMRAGVIVLCSILCHPFVSQDQVLFPIICVKGTAPKNLESVEPCSLSPSSVQCPSGT